MLPTDSPELRTRPESVCFVVGDLRGLTGPGAPPVAERCRQGGVVHVLWCGDPKDAADPLGQLRAAGALVHLFDQTESPRPFRVRNLYDLAPADRSDHVRHAVDRLHRASPLDRIEFGVYGGLGFRALQAKRAGLAFADVILAVRFDECSQQIRESAQRWPSGLEELELDYLERHSFETADVQVLPDPRLVDTLRGLGWVVRAGEPGRAGEGGSPNGDPLVTVGIAHYNLGQYLPATLGSLAAQTYQKLDVLVIDDGSTDRRSVETFAELEARYPAYRFLRQANAGIGATRNRCLAEARGEFFIPMDADNLARPDMVERFVAAIRRNPQLSAMTCYHLAFTGDTETSPDEFAYACRPTGGPHTMASIRNVYGDANAVFRTAAFRAVGGYETDRRTSCEDWEAFVKLVHAGKRIGVIPDHLFYYRHRDGGFSRVTNWFANHQRVLRQFKKLDHLPADEAAVLWTALLGFQQRVEQLTEQRRCLRYRIADRVHAVWTRVPVGRRGIKRLVGMLKRSVSSGGRSV